VKGRKYWYFDTPKEGGGQNRKYAGAADDPEITKRVETFKDLKADIRSRRKLVSTLVREAYLPRAEPEEGYSDTNASSKLRCASSETTECSRDGIG
jgi:hypothetical protein